MSEESPELTNEDRERLLYAIQSLAEIGEELSSTETFSSSSNSILHLIMGTVVISKAAVLVYNESNRTLEIAASRGVEDGLEPLLLPHIVQRALHKRNSPIRISDPQDETLVEYFQQHESELVDLHSHVWLPLSVKSRLLGVISVSRKFMNQDYDEVDLELLHIISQQLSIALNNFYLIKDLKKTNFQLQRKLLEQESLFDLGIAIASIMDQQELVETILFNAVALTDSSSGFLALWEDDQLVMKSAINLSDEAQRKLADFATAKELRDTDEYYLDNSDSSTLHEFNIRKLLIVPVRGQRQSQGLLGLADKESRDGIASFEDVDVRLLQNFGTQAGVAIENARFYAESLEKERYERELSVAATIQQNILPEKPPAIDGLQIAATTIPSRFVGGDHYDFIERPGDHIFSVADVSGKGIPAALLVSTLHATMHALVQNQECPKTLVQQISKSVFKSSLSNKFITFFLTQYFPEQQMIRTINAGHNPPYLVSADGTLRTLRTGGLVLGLMPEVDYQSEDTMIHSGDLLVTFTDGVSEAMDEDEEEFGEERLEKLIVDNRHKTAQEVFDIVMQEIETFTAGAPQHDDITLVIFKFE